MWYPAFTTKALRDIAAGEELLYNYIVFGGEEDYNSGAIWKEEVLNLRAMCSGQAVGIVEAYEAGEKGAGV